MQGGTIDAGSREISLPGATINMSSGLIRAGEEGIVGGNGSTITINNGMVFGGQNGIRLLSGFPSVPVLVNVAGGTVEGTAGAGIVQKKSQRVGH